jgi:hypothetical protein
MNLTGGRQKFTHCKGFYHKPVLTKTTNRERQVQHSNVPVDIGWCEASNESSFSDLFSKTLILPPSRLFAVTQEFPREVF